MKNAHVLRGECDTCGPDTSRVSKHKILEFCIATHTLKWQAAPASGK